LAFKYLTESDDRSFVKRYLTIGRLFFGEKPATLIFFNEAILRDAGIRGISVI